MTIYDFKSPTRIEYIAPFNQVWGEHESNAKLKLVDVILIAHCTAKDLKLNENEVMAVKWVTQ